MSKKVRSRYQVIKNNGVYFITSTIIEWIPVFTKREYFDIIVQSLSYCRQNKGLKLFAYVVMDNHVHFIASMDEKVFRQKVEYTHNNPGKRGFVEQAEHWVYSSERNYSTGDGYIKIDLIEI